MAGLSVCLWSIPVLELVKRGWTSKEASCFRASALSLVPSTELLGAPFSPQKPSSESIWTLFGMFGLDTLGRSFVEGPPKCWASNQKRGLSEMVSAPKPLHF